jgi:sugar (pentulose or hexulose) kinase
MQAAYSSVFGSATFAPGDRRNLAAWWHAVESALAALKAEADLSGARCLAVDGTSGTMLLLNDAGQPMREASLHNYPAPEVAMRAVAAATPTVSAAVGAASPLAKLLAMQDVPGKPTGLQLGWAHLWA